MRPEILTQQQPKVNMPTIPEMGPIPRIHAAYWKAVRTGTVLQLRELISEQRGVLPNFSLMDISVWGTQSQTAAFTFSETLLLHLETVSLHQPSKKAGYDFRQYFRSSRVNQT